MLAANKATNRSESNSGQRSNCVQCSNRNTGKKALQCTSNAYNHSTLCSRLCVWMPPRTRRYRLHTTLYTSQQQQQHHHHHEYHQNQQYDTTIHKLTNSRGTRAIPRLKTLQTPPNISTLVRREKATATPHHTPHSK